MRQAAVIGALPSWADPRIRLTVFITRGGLPPHCVALFRAPHPALRVRQLLQQAVRYVEQRLHAPRRPLVPRPPALLVACGAAPPVALAAEAEHGRAGRSAAGGPGGVPLASGQCRTAPLPALLGQTSGLHGWEEMSPFCNKYTKGLQCCMAPS